MKKLIIALILGITLTIIVHRMPFSFENNYKKDSSSALRIAIFTPTTHPALEEIEQGFKEYLQQSSSQRYCFTTFNANGNKSLLRAQAEEIVHNNYNLIFTIGATCTQVTATLLNKKGIQKPHVFTAVDGPEFAQSITALNTYSTGVYVTSHYTKEIDILYKYKPHTKNIALVYDPNNNVQTEKYTQEIAEHVQKYGANLHTIEVYQTNEIQQKVAAMLPSMDVVLVLTDNTIVAGIDTLITLCNRYGVTLLASDLASGKKGAALAYGITEYESGSTAAQKAHAILMQHKKPIELPISAVTSYRIAINTGTMKAQNLDIDRTLLEQLT